MNLKFKKPIAISIAIAVAVCLMTLVISPACSAIFAVAFAVIIGLFAHFTSKCDRQIRSLSNYLVRLTNGIYDADLRDNAEGSLSVLKSDIYKVSVALREKAELLAKDKTYLADSISDISHQLKTPMTSMLVMTDLLADEGLPQDKREEFLGNIRSQLHRLEWLVSSLLKLSRLDTGTIVMKKELVNAGKLIAKASEHLLIPIEMKGIDFSVEGADTEVLCDINWTAEALANILKNCIEHTSEGGSISVCVKSNPIFDIISITDNGCGIDKSDLPYIFKRFYKGKNSAPDSVGIGLAMAHNIIAVQGGKVICESEQGSGTCFEVRIYKAVV